MSNTPINSMTQLVVKIKLKAKEDLPWHESRIEEVVTEPSIKAEELNTIVEEVELKHIDRDMVVMKNKTLGMSESLQIHTTSDDAAAFRTCNRGSGEASSETKPILV